MTFVPLTAAAARARGFTLLAMGPPGGRRDTGDDAEAAWDSRLRGCFESALAGAGEHPFLLPAPDERTRELTGPDWTGLPTRVQSCLGRAAALAVLDDERGLQEEYLEWRVVRDDDGTLRRVELTTELRDFWRVLAAHEPERTLELAGELVDRPVGVEDDLRRPPARYAGGPRGRLRRDHDRAAAIR